MENLKLNLENIFQFVPKEEVFRYKEEITGHIAALHNKTGKGNDFLGWLELPSSITESDLAGIEEVAAELRGKSEVLVVVGIGVSYLGAKAVIEAMTHSFASLLPQSQNPFIVYAGQNLGEDYLVELMDLLDKKSYSVVVISKSGTTTEPAIAFRLLKKHLQAKYGQQEARTRIVAVTDATRGALRTLAEREGYRTFVIPDDVGGRYSVPTPVGLLPVAVAGIDIRSLLKGARVMEKQCGMGIPFEQNPATLYAAARNALYNKGTKVEIMVNYHPKLHYLTEWWKQLYGESEGKEGKGIFPAGVDFTTDLHSLGQYIQDGERMLSETVLSVGNPDRELIIPEDPDNLDKLNFLAGKRMDEVNKKAEQGTLLAHIDGGVPNIHISIPALNPFYLGQLIYFFEKGCAISGYMLGVNPFDQPGVEAYKKNMFRLLGKPGA
ncbi:MAG: glucose-6-phosphate isomerase [Bacteroidetes bacterium]|nr:glucose-6-phosphate isomerase [Bacteroidota bacterium]